MATLRVDPDKTSATPHGYDPHPRQTKTWRNLEHQAHRRAARRSRNRRTDHNGDGSRRHVNAIGHRALDGREHKPGVSHRSAHRPGPLTIGGTINLQTGHVTLPGGTLTLSHTQSWGTQGANPQTCLTTLTSSGTYKVTGGTGRYERVQGHGTYRLTAYAIVKKVQGKCAINVVPYAQTELLTATGRLTG